MKTTQKQQKTKKRNNTVKYILLRSILFSIITVVFIIIFAPNACATSQIELISQTNTLEYGSIQNILMNITSNNTITQALIEFESQNHTLQKENQLYTYSWVPQQKGVYQYKVYVTESNNELTTYANSFNIIDTTPPEITSTSPGGTLNYNLIELKAITNENSTCKYDEADVSYDSMYFTLSGEELIHTKLRSFGEGQYTAYVRCKDTSNNIGLSKIISFVVDTKPPGIETIAPTGTVTQQQLTLRIITNEIASCKWSRTNQAYDSLENYFQITNSKQHEQPITLSDGINTYYISCQDQVGNKQITIPISIEFNLPPKATIGVDVKGNYRELTQGTYKVSLLATEPLTQAPSLKLRYGARLVSMPLEGSADYWTGYLIIPADAGKEVGEFLFSGTDNKGMTGTEITSGKLILLDTTIPPVPTGLKLENQDNKIILSWQYDGEEIYHFNIYRSTTGNTGKANLKTTAKEENYEDSDVTNKIGYFYRISAVDKAGNEGLLSEEEFLMTEYQNTTTFKQSQDILDIINTKISELERLVQDIDVKTANLEQTTDQGSIRIINSEGLVEKQKEIKGKIQVLIGELMTYKEVTIRNEELNTKNAIISSKVEEYKEGVVDELKLINKAENEQILEENIVLETVKEYLKNKQLTEEQKLLYQAAVKELQNEVRVRREIANYEIIYQYKESRKITTVKETIISPKELNKTLAQEVIPKSELKISEITFDKTPEELNSLGVMWALNALENSEIFYRVSGEKDITQLQEIRTVLLYDVDEFLSGVTGQNTNQQNSITGGAVSQSSAKFAIRKEVLIAIGTLIVLGLLIYYFIFLKPGGPNNESETTNVIINKESPYQDASLINSSEKVKTNLAQMLDIIQKSYEELDKDDLEVASNSYYAAFLLYSRASLGLKERLTANFEMNNLREKIIIAQKTKHLYT